MTTFNKSKPREIIYRSYKQFDESKFKNDLVKKHYPTSFNCENYNAFETLFLEVLDVHTPLK